MANAARLDLADGRSVFAKSVPGAPPDTFETEAAGLRWLAEPAVVAVPDVLAVLGDPPVLVLSWIDTTAAPAPDDVAFGRQLARLHASGAPCFGRSDRRPTGSRRLPNEPHTTWAAAYSANRLLPLADLAAQERSLPERSLQDLRRVAQRLPELGGDPEPPARLHGDLWAGNRVVDRHGGSWLVDPAAHGGHREFDLAMMRLFGGFGPDTFTAYDELHPLAHGWQDRVELHQLAPLVVHAIKFGGSYVPAAVAAIERYR